MAMPDEVMDDKAGTGVPGTEQTAPEIAPASPTGGGEGTPSSQNEAQFWTVGDQKFPQSLEGAHQMAKAWGDWWGKNTKSSQERAAKDKELTQKMGQYEAIVSVIRSDESLRQLVLQKIQAGQSPRQAVGEVAAQAQAQLPPEYVERLEKIEAAERERVEDAAIDAFGKSHKDISDKEWDEIGDWIDKQEWVQRLEPHQQLSIAYAEVVVPKRSASLIQMGQKQKEEEIRKGERSSFLGSQAPTAGAKPSGMPERKRHMTPAEEREYALKVFRASGKK